MANEQADQHEFRESEVPEPPEQPQLSMNDTISVRSEDGSFFHVTLNVLRDFLYSAATDATDDTGENVDDPSDKEPPEAQSKKKK